MGLIGVYLYHPKGMGKKRTEGKTMTMHSMEPRIKELQELKRMKEELEAEIEAIEDEIKLWMGDEETLLAGAYKVTWKPVTTSRFDSTAFKKDHAELAAGYMKTTTCRRFTVN